MNSKKLLGKIPQFYIYMNLDYNIGGNKIMAFSEDVVDRAWNRSGGRCECRRKTHNHPYGRCPQRLSKGSRGRESGRGAWETHHRVSGGSDGLSNCEILCWACHKKTM